MVSSFAGLVEKLVIQQRGKEEIAKVIEKPLVNQNVT